MHWAALWLCDLVQPSGYAFKASIVEGLHKRDLVSLYFSLMSSLFYFSYHLFLSFQIGNDGGGGEGMEGS